MKPSIKTLLIITALSGTLSTTALADSNPSTGASAAMGSQSKILADIDGILHATAATATRMAYQVDQYLSSIENSNTAANNMIASNTSAYSIPSSTSTPQVTLSPTGLANYINFQASQATNKNVASTLMLGPSIVNPDDNKAQSEFLTALFQNSPNKPDANTAINLSDLTTQLTFDTPADDTLYLNDPVVGNSNNKNYLHQGDRQHMTKPKQNFTSYMSAPTFTSPFNGSYFTTKNTSASSSDNPYNIAYSTNAAKSYLAYLTSAFNPVGADINWYKLAPKAVADDSGSGESNKPSVRANDILTLKHSEQYKTYQLTVRNIVAARSMVTDLLNQLLVERTPSAQLAKEAQLPSQYTTQNNYVEVNGKMTGPVTTVSPLQLENYIANHRVNSSKWYQAMSTASPAVVQRETLFVLAEILSKMQQAHIDNEKLQMISALQAIGEVNGMKSLAATQANAVNQEIEQLSGVKKSTSATDKSIIKTFTGK